MSTRTVIGVALLVNVVAVLCAVNPWFPAFSAAGVTFLVLEAAFGLLGGVPVFLYHHRRLRKPVRRSLVDTLDSLLQFLTGWV